MSNYRKNVVIPSYLYLKLCWNRAMSHASLPLNIFEKAALLLLLGKAYGVENPLLIVLLILGGVVLAVIIGHLDLVYGIADAEASLSNRYNPEIRDTHKRVLRTAKAFK